MVRRHSRLRRIVLGLQISVLLGFGIGIGGVVGGFITVSRDLEDISGYSPPEVTKIFSSDGILLATVGEENREFVDLKQVPKELQDATIAVEDSRFYDHAGIDLRGISRAMVRNIKGGEMKEGGSTITQQLARNVYLTQKKTISRKAREAVLAVMIERNYTKRKILELYLNQVYYGSSAFGVETASKIYFGKNVKNLNLSECALLAGLPKSPSYLSPHENLEGAIRRRNVVLSRMLELNYITQEEYEKAREHKPRIVPLKPTKYRSKAPYFTDYVKRYLRDNYEYGDDLILRGGLRVHTTLNYEMQLAAQKAVTKGVQDAKKAGKINPDNGNAALVCIEPANGYIRAMVGGESYEKSEFNRAVQAKRQPGSAFKAFVYTAAVDMLGWDASHRVLDARIYKTDDLGRVWAPVNYDGKYRGMISIKRAVAESVNTAAIRTGEQVGIENVVKYAKMMGIKSELQPYPALAIGGIGGVSVLEMASAYGVFAAKGDFVEPTPIIKITDSNGQLIDEHPTHVRHVLTERTLKIMDEMFRSVVTSGTGRSVSVIPEARGKTGTTNEDRDAWFVGYVPNKLVTAVWMGNDNHTPMRKVYGGTLCGPIWREFMETGLRVHKETHQPKQPPKPKEQVESQNPPRPRPETENTSRNEQNEVNNEQEEPSLGTVRVKICNESALLATQWCPAWHRDTFVEGTQPTGYCNIHGPRGGGQPNEETGTTGEGEPGDNQGGLRLTPPTTIPPDR